MFEETNQKKYTTTFTCKVPNKDPCMWRKGEEGKVKISLPYYKSRDEANRAYGPGIGFGKEVKDDPVKGLDLYGNNCCKVASGNKVAQLFCYIFSQGMNKLE